SQLTYSHYWVAGAIMAELRSSLPEGNLQLYMAHSWDQIAKKDDPTRKLTLEREQVEQRVLINFDCIIVATNAERKLLAHEYDHLVPGGAEAILAKTHVVPLGVDKEKFNPERMSELRDYARREFL